MTMLNKELHEMAMYEVSVRNGTALDVTGVPLRDDPNYREGWDAEMIAHSAEMLAVFTKAADEFWLSSDVEDLLRTIDAMPAEMSTERFKKIAQDLRGHDPRFVYAA